VAAAPGYVATVEIAEVFIEVDDVVTVVLRTADAPGKIVDAGPEAVAAAISVMAINASTPLVAAQLARSRPFYPVSQAIARELGRSTNNLLSGNSMWCSVCHGYKLHQPNKKLHEMDQS